MISIIYRTTVDVPEKVFRNLGPTGTFDRGVMACTAGTAASGQDTYGTAYVWAEDSDRQLIEQVDAKLRAQFAAWEKEIK
jgi:hypothetical protein